MPIYYNTASPSYSTKNTINGVTVDYGIRDFLLNLNLPPSYPTISTSLNGSPRIGEPLLDLTVNNNVNVIPNFLPLETNGIIFKDNNISVNTFQNTASTANDLLGVQYLPSNPDSNWPNTPISYPIGVNESIIEYGLLAKTKLAETKNKNLKKNLYKDESQQLDVADFIVNDQVNFTNQISGYLDEKGGLNIGGGGAIKTANIIGSVLSGQGLGFGSGGLTTSFNIRSSIAGRLLGATGIINDTKLGMVGGQQLALALANNAAFNVQQELLGALNVKDNILSLIKGDGLVGLRPTYKITVPSTTGGRILDTAGKILGFTIPRSYLGDAGSIFQTENGDSENIDRANEMLKYTGSGQALALISNFKANLDGISNGGVDSPLNSVFRSGYSPAYSNNKGDYSKDAISSPNLYAYSNGQGHFVNLLSSMEFGVTGGVIPSLSYNREQKVIESGFLSPEEIGAGPRGNSGYENRKVSDVNFTWTSTNGEAVNTINELILPDNFRFIQDIIGRNDELVGDRKSLLIKTQKLFNSKGMINIITAKGDMDKKSSQIQTANGKGFSKGNAVLKASLFNEQGRYKGEENISANDTYCRSWTTLDRYDRVKKLVRSGTDGIDNKGATTVNGINTTVPYRNNTQGSILSEFGIPKITPYTDDIPTDPKQYMFSIENLAWADSNTLLPRSERGPGDLLTGKKGRIMWFPPYNINFSENSSLSWETSNFIGRGEPIYTYNNTERTGNLSFQIIVDHPSYINSFRGEEGPDDSYMASFWAGCIDPDSKFSEKLTPSQISDIVKSTPINEDVKVIEEEVVPTDISVYFPNDNAAIELLYENGLNNKTDSTPIDYSVNENGEDQGLGNYMANYTPGARNNSIQSDGEGWPDRYNFGLNYSENIEEKRSPATSPTIVCADSQVLNGYFDPKLVELMTKHLIEVSPNFIATITGYASRQGNIVYNNKLAKDRAINLKEDIKQRWWPSIKAGSPKLTDADFDKRFIIGETIEIQSIGCIPCEGIPKLRQAAECPTDSLACKQDRVAKVSFIYSKDIAGEDLPKKEVINDDNNNRRINNKISGKYYNETLYFDKLTDEDPLVFDSFRQKIKYFHPAFHSTTPEGLNSRLTFLLQCTRQGPTMEEQGATNLAFGRPPICILRIGDFYNTKIVIDNVSIDYEPLVWDLNPEGIGVQPMIANVSMSFKFIGGSTLMGPINKLQNALSFNYFANTQVYDPRADYISKDKPMIAPAKVSEIAPVIDEPFNGIELAGVEIVNTFRPWYLHNGIKDISEIEKDENGMEIIDNENINQEKENETEVSQSGQSTSVNTDLEVTVSDYDILKNFLTLKKDYFTIQISTFNTLGGKFGFDSNQELSKEYDVKITLNSNVTTMNSLELVSFKLKNITEENNTVFLSEVKNWGAIIGDFAIEPSNKLTFVISIPELDIKFFYDRKYLRDSKTLIDFVN